MNTNILTIINPALLFPWLPSRCCRDVAVAAVVVTLCEVVVAVVSMWLHKIKMAIGRLIQDGGDRARTRMRHAASRLPRVWGKRSGLRVERGRSGFEFFFFFLNKQG